MVQVKSTFRIFFPSILFILLALSACQGQATLTASNPTDESEFTMPTDTAVVNPTIEPTDTVIPDPSPTVNPTDTSEPPTPEVDETNTPSSPTETTAPSDPIGEVSFENDVLPIFQNSCTRCHGSSKAEEGLRLNTYANMMLGSEDGPVVIPGDPDGSLLLQVIIDGSMPKRGEALTPDEIEIIKAWILAGAQDN